MEALSVAEIPAGDEWLYEPKWDGFRCLAFRDGESVELQSKAGQPLARYFPEIVEELRKVSARNFVIDGEIVVPSGQVFSFDDLLARLHPAESRIKKLAAATPAILIVFDLLVDGKNALLFELPLRERRPKLEKFAARFFKNNPSLRLSPATPKVASAKKWLAQVGATLDGIIAKRADLPYRSGDRTGMQKIKNYRSADCVAGGFRFATGTSVVGSILLGLYDDAGLLNHVGFTSAIKHAERAALTKKLTPLTESPGFTGNAPGGPSRWNKGEAREWKPLRPELVLEVEYDHFSGDRFRHGTSILRWRPDKAPAQCTMDQVKQKRANLMRLLA